MSFTPQRNALEIIARKLNEFLGERHGTQQLDACRQATRILCQSTSILVIEPVYLESRTEQGAMT